MRIVVVDNSTSGHRETYYKRFAQTWADLGFETFLLAPTDAGPDCPVTCRPLHFRPLLTLPPGKGVRKKITVLKNARIRLENLRSLRQQLKQIKPGLVFFACLDEMLPTLSTRFLTHKLMPYKWSGLLVQSVFPPLKFFAPDIRLSLRSENCVALGVLNEYSVNSLLPFKPQICLFPDFADNTPPDLMYPLWQEVHRKAAGRKIISLLGSIDIRKGIDLFTRIIRLLPAEDYFFLLAGKSTLSPDNTRNLRTLSASRNNFLFSPHRIPDEASFNALVAGSNLIFAVYRHFTGSSNLLTKAAIFGVPVLVAKGYCMGKRVEEYKTGLTVGEEEVEEAVTAIKKLTTTSLDNMNFEQYKAQHTTGKLKDCFTRIIQLLP